MGRDDYRPPGFGPVDFGVHKATAGCDATLHKRVFEDDAPYLEKMWRGMVTPPSGPKRSATARKVVLLFFENGFLPVADFELPKRSFAGRSERTKTRRPTGQLKQKLHRCRENWFG